MSALDTAVTKLGFPAVEHEHACSLAHAPPVPTVESVLVGDIDPDNDVACGNCDGRIDLAYHAHTPDPESGEYVCESCSEEAETMTAKQAWTKYHALAAESDRRIAEASAALTSSHEALKVALALEYSISPEAS